MQAHRESNVGALVLTENGKLLNKFHGIAVIGIRGSVITVDDKQVVYSLNPQHLTLRRKLAEEQGQELSKIRSKLLTTISRWRALEQRQTGPGVF